MRVALLHVVAFLAGGVLDEEEVVVGIACDRPVALFADLERPGLPCEQLQVHAHLGVWKDRPVLPVGLCEWRAALV